MPHIIYKCGKKPCCAIYNVSGLENYCRNPDDDAYGPWCFVDIDTGEMEYCDIPKCGQ